MTVLDTSLTVMNITSCDSLFWNGLTYYTSGTYTYLTTNVSGCDSTVVLNLTIDPSPISTTTITACDSLVWNGVTYTTSGVYDTIFSFNSNPSSGTCLLYTSPSPRDRG